MVALDEMKQRNGGIIEHEHSDAEAAEFIGPGKRDTSDAFESDELHVNGDINVPLCMESCGQVDTSTVVENDGFKRKEEENGDNIGKTNAKEDTGRDGRPGDIDGGYAWVVLAATWGSFLICGSFVLTSGLVHTALLARFRRPVAQTAWAGSVFIAVVSLSSPLGSAIIDRFSCRVAVMIGGATTAAGFLLTGLAPSLGFCVFSYGIVTGTGSGITFAVLFVVNGFNFQRRLNLAQGISLSGTGVGVFLMAPMFETAKIEWGFSGMCFVLSACAMQLIVFGALMRPSSLERELRSLRDLARTKQSTTILVNVRESARMYGYALCEPYVLLLAFSMFFFCGGIYAMFLHWPNFCLHEGFSQMQSSYALSIVGLISIGGRLCSGIVASLRYISERIVYCGSLTILGASMISFFLFSKTFAGHIGQAVVVGLLNGSPYVVITSLSARGVGVEFLASALGFEFMMGGVGSIIVPLLSGYMIQGGLSYDVVFVVCGLCMLVSAVLGFATKFVKKRDVCAKTAATDAVEVIAVEPEKEALVATTEHTVQMLTNSRECVKIENC